MADSENNPDDIYVEQESLATDRPELLNLRTNRPQRTNLQSTNQPNANRPSPPGILNDTSSRPPLIPTSNRPTRSTRPRTYHPQSNRPHLSNHQSTHSEEQTTRPKSAYTANSPSDKKYTLSKSTDDCPNKFQKMLGDIKRKLMRVSNKLNSSNRSEETSLSNGAFADSTLESGSNSQATSGSISLNKSVPRIPTYRPEAPREIDNSSNSAGPLIHRKPCVPRVHTTVDFIHCLVPYLAEITASPYYWGVMDRYEAERLLENKPEGTFLLRDSSQDEFLFSVSFRRYSRSLHARVEQWNHKFSFDYRDESVFKAPSIKKLLAHYNNPNTCMFFEPMLTDPLNRPQPFTLQQLARSVICDKITYDGIDYLPLPRELQEFLRRYHYKQKVRVRSHEESESSTVVSVVVQIK